MIIDTKGKLCPAPLIMTKKGIGTATPGEIIEVITDNATSYGNLINYLAELKITPETQKEGDVYTLTFTKTGNERLTEPAEHYCSTSSPDYVVAIKSDKMGIGDDELGAILLRAFINTLPEAEHLPSAILLYNSGVKIALKGTDTAASLQKLEEKGITIVACGTCLDFFNVKEQLAVGMVGNMYKIVQLLSQAGHVVYP